MGCGASVEPGKTDSAETSLKAPQEPVVPVDPSKFTSVCKKAQGQRATWLAASQLLVISSDNEAEVHPLEVLDLTTTTFQEVGSLKGLAWPLVTASRDRQRYAAVAGLEVQVRSSATHETTLTLSVPGQGANYVSSLEFSPDGRHLAAVVDNVCTVYDMEGNSVLTVEGEKRTMSACWYDADTLLSMNEWIIYYHTLSSKELINKWELPQGTVAEAHVSKDKKLLVSDDNAHLKLLSWEPDMKAFETLQTFDAPPGNYSGPSNLVVFSDERSVLYEPGGGGNFRYHNLETGEIITVPRGEGPEEGLASVSQATLAPAEDYIAILGFSGLEVFRLIRAAPENPA